MNYTVLEALDRKWGRAVTIDDWRRLGEKAAADLTDDDITIIEGFAGPKDAAAARARRALALNPPAPDPPATAPLVTKATKLPASRTYVDACLKHFASDVRDVIGEPLYTRLEALEQRIKDQSDRILQLEAQAAARTVTQ